MSRTKKSRNAGNSEPGFTGVRKETSATAQEARERKRKAKLKGNKAGARWKDVDGKVQLRPCTICSKKAGR